MLMSSSSESARTQTFVNAPPSQSLSAAVKFMATWRTRWASQIMLAWAPWAISLRLASPSRSTTPTISDLPSGPTRPPVVLRGGPDAGPGGIGDPQGLEEGLAAAVVGEHLGPVVPAVVRKALS